MQSCLEEPLKLLRLRMICPLAGLMLLFALDFAARQEPTPALQNPTSTQDPAAVKAAERKKRFEEERRRLEEGTTDNLAGVVSSPNQTLFVSPAKVSMLAADSQSFCVFDIEGHDLTASAEWSLSTSGVVDLVSEPEPEITARNQGNVRLLAKVNGQVAEATVAVFSGDKLPVGTVRWQTPLIPGYRNENFVQAMGTTNGVDIYMMDKNENGDAIIRAIRSDGRQVWMKRFPSGTSPQLGPALSTSEKAPSSSKARP